jgi:hypothetical protein
MRTAAVVLALIAVTGCEHPKPQQERTPPPVSTSKLVTALAPAGSQLAELRSQPESDNTVSLHVSMPGAANTITLPSAAYSDTFRESQEPVTVGDPLDPAKVTAMVSGEDEKAVTTWLRPVRSPKANCVLAEQEFGFEVIKRNHTLICPRDGQLQVIWKAEDGEGPAWTTVDVKDVNHSGSDDLIVYQGFASPDGAETLDVKLLQWSGADLKESSLPVRTVTAGSFPGASNARQARDAAGKKDALCAKYFWVLAAPGSRFDLVAKTTVDAPSLPSWQHWKACYPTLKISN